MKRKQDTSLVRTIFHAKKQPAWRMLAQILSGPTRRYTSVNLDEINKYAKEGDTIIVTGKVLGGGMVTKKIKICALQFSESAVTKLKGAKIAVHSINDEITKNPKAEGVRVYGNNH